MKILDKRQVQLLHQQLIEASGGSPGLRDEGLLESALSAPFQSFWGGPAPTLPYSRRPPVLDMAW